MTPPENANKFLWGFVLVILLDILQIVVFSRLPLYLVGVTQFLYVVPLAWLAYRRHAISFVQGILTAAGITVLLNGLCYLMLVRPLLQHARHHATFR